MDEINYITGLQKFEGMSLREISKKMTTFQYDKEIRGQRGLER